jgi:hypothetical protein
MNIIKSRMRNSLDNSSLKSCLRLSLKWLPIAIDNLTAQIVSNMSLIILG